GAKGGDYGITAAQKAKHAVFGITVQPCVRYPALRCRAGDRVLPVSACAAAFLPAIGSSISFCATFLRPFFGARAGRVASAVAFSACTERRKASIKLMTLPVGSTFGASIFSPLAFFSIKSFSACS